MSELIIEDLGAVGLLRLNRPEKHNALNTALTTAPLDALRQADHDDAVRAACWPARSWTSRRSCTTSTC